MNTRFILKFYDDFQKLKNKLEIDLAQDNLGAIYSDIAKMERLLRELKLSITHERKNDKK